MYRSHLALSTLLIVLLAPGLSMADQTTVCDPETDPNECQCPADPEPYDRCQNIAANGLAPTGDPEFLREAAQIESTYDETDETYDVTVDATQFNGGGILLMHSNRGHWESWDHLLRYMGELGGIPDLPCGLDLFDLHQNGKTVKFNQFENRWATRSYGNLFLDAVSDDQGDVYIRDVKIDGWPYALGSPQCLTKSTTYFEAKQCSAASQSATVVERSPVDVCPEIFPPDADTWWESVAGSQLNEFEGLQVAAKTNWEMYSVCGGGWYECTRFRSREFHADEARLENKYYSDRSFRDAEEKSAMDTPGITLSRSDHAVTEQGAASPAIINGVCGFGQADRGVSHLEFDTADGQYAADCGE